LLSGTLCVIGMQPNDRLLTTSQQLYFAAFDIQAPGWYTVLNSAPASRQAGIIQIHTPTSQTMSVTAVSSATENEVAKYLKNNCKLTIAVIVTKNVKNVTEIRSGKLSKEVTKNRWKKYNLLANLLT